MAQGLQPSDGGDDGKLSAACGGKEEHQEGRSGGEAQADDRAPAQAHAHRAQQAGRVGGEAEEALNFWRFKQKAGPKGPASVCGGSRRTRPTSVPYAQPLVVPQFVHL